MSAQVPTPKDFEVSRPDVVTQAQRDILEKLDPDKPLERIDASNDRVDWAEEERRGNVVRVRQTGAFQEGKHAAVIQGQPQTLKEAVERRRTREEMRHIFETGRLPTPGDGEASGKLTYGPMREPKGGWPSFLDHAPFHGEN